MKFLVAFACALLLSTVVSLAQFEGPRKVPVSGVTPPGTEYAATVVEDIDGDTVKVTIESFRNTPFYELAIRVYGIDTPETRIPPGKCTEEVKAGLAAENYARTLIKPGDNINLVYQGLDKYGSRIDARVILQGNRDFASLMLASNKAAPYDGGTKQDWCKVLKAK